MFNNSHQTTQIILSVYRTRLSEKIIDAPVVEFSGGRISGKCCNTLPPSKIVYSYPNIPFAKYDRFEKPIKYESWKGVRDGTGLTEFQPQISSYHALEGMAPVDALFERESRRKCICN